LDNNNTAASRTPVTVVGLQGFVSAITAGGFYYNHSCAVIDGGKLVQCWGDNALDNETGARFSTPAPGFFGVYPQCLSYVSTTATFVSASGGRSFNCAVLSDGNVECWGGDTGGAAIHQCGQGDYRSYEVSVISGLADSVARVSAGDSHVCALLTNGAVQCWSYLGNMRGTAYAPDTVSLDGLATAVASGDNYSCALLAQGTVQCWGANSSGQLGNGTTVDSLTPVSVH
jgi:alpha-tubulin suppressor-like RCC1 family protein